MPPSPQAAGREHTDRLHALVWARSRPAELRAVTNLIAWLSGDGARHNLGALNILDRTPLCPLNLDAPAVVAHRRNGHWAWVLLRTGDEAATPVPHRAAADGYL